MKSSQTRRLHKSRFSDSPMSGFVDLHMHVLPGMDHGPTDMATSLEMLRTAVKGGTCAVCATPHASGPEFDWIALDARIAELRSAVQEKEIPVHIYPGAEYRLDEWMIDFAAKGQLVTLGRSKNILIELPFTQMPVMAWQILFEVQARGYGIVVAHPERNADIQMDLAIANELIHKGCLLQVSGSSITGEHGKISRKTALNLISDGNCHAVASDGHAASGGRESSLANAYKQVTRRFNASLAWKLFSDGPAGMVTSVDQ